MKTIKQILLQISLLFWVSQAWAGHSLLIYLKDKGPASGSSCLSAEALQKRARKGISLQDSDYPLHTAYLQQLQKAGIEVEMSSRWFNFVKAQSPLSRKELLNRFSFIADVVDMPGSSGTVAFNKLPSLGFTPLSIDAVVFGQTDTQNSMLNLQCLHDQGNTGENVLIAVFDTGFLGVDTIGAYNHIRQENRFVAYRNFSDPGNSVFSTDAHGTMVFSAMAGLIPGIFVGAAPKARYALAVTEKLGSETHQEELNWLAAAEWADSLGADIIQSSLTYKTFDPGQGDYNDNQLDGKTAIITKAAVMAARKGILVVNSAGNDGSIPAPLSNKIGPPCDADSILAVGSVTGSGVYHSLSSIGPSADGRIKPELMAMGNNTVLLNNRGNLQASNGTSFSSPLISGLAACLMQANPQRAWWEVRRAMIVSGSQVNTPDAFMGYGIPNACRADSLLKTYNALPERNLQVLKQKIKLFPTVSSGRVQVQILDPHIQAQSLALYSMQGTLLLEISLDAEENFIDLGNLAASMYNAQVKLAGGQVLNYRLLKQ